MKPKEKQSSTSSSNRRKSVYIKRIELEKSIDVSIGSSSPVSRRTRRQSMANLKSSGNTKVRLSSGIPRATSERAMRKKQTKHSNEPLDMCDLSPSKVNPKVVISPIKSKFMDKNIFYGSEKTARTSQFIAPSRPNCQKVLPSRGKSKANEKPKVSNLKKQVKRLENASCTPPASHSKLTGRASSKKESNGTSQKSNRKLKGSKTKTPKSNKKGTFLFTPKLEDPSGLIKQHLKKKVSSELRAFRVEHSKLKMANGFSENEESPELDRDRTTAADESPPSLPSDFHLPATPVSSRKSQRNGSFNLRSSTPVKLEEQSSFRSKLNFGDNLPHNLSSNGEESNGIAPIASDESSDQTSSPTPEPSKKNGYCVVM